MPRQKVRIKVRVSKEAVKPGRVKRLRRLFSRWQYFLLIAVAAVASVVLVWMVLSQTPTALPPPPE